MRRFCVFSLFVSYVFLMSALSLNAQAHPPTTNTYFPTEVSDSVSGFQAQVDELIRVGKMHDQAAWNTVLDTFALPKGSAWFEANFAQQHVAQLSEDYPKVRDGHLGHISWVLGHNVDAPGFSIKVEPSEMPAPPSDVVSNPFSPVPCFPSLSRIHVSKIKVLSGDREFIEDAKRYVKSAQFPEMPNIPQLANAERKWDFEVAFFKPKS